MAMPSDAEAEATLRRWGHHPTDLRATNYHGENAWHIAGASGRIDMCRWLKARGASDVMDARGDGPRCPYGGEGTTPLMKAIAERKEETAQWLVANGADVKATESDGSTVFANACAHLSCEFVRALAEKVIKVPPEHLAMPNAFDHTPMYYAAVDNSQRYAAPPCGPKTLTFAAAAGLTFSRMRTTTPTRGCWPGPRQSSRSTAPLSSSCSAVESTRPAATTSLPRSEDTSRSCGATATRACECASRAF